MYNIKWTKDTSILNPGLETLKKKSIITISSFDQPRNETFYPIISGLESKEHSKEKLILLLKIAAEIEHRLMIQYLFAMFTIKEGSTNDADNLRKTVLRPIAIQEMGHFLAVQNLLLSIGGIGSLHLHKDTYLSGSKDNPVNFSLESFSTELLAEFVAVEAPLIFPADIETELKKIFEIGEKHAGGKIQSVGGVYERIFWLFQPYDVPVSNINLMQLKPKDGILLEGDHVSDGDFQTVSEIEKYEAFRDLWNNGGSVITQSGITLENVYSRNNALFLVNQIAEQGEGFDFNTIDSHFEKFFKAYTLYKDKSIEVYKTLPNLATKSNPNFKNITLITNGYSLIWADLFNKTYSSLLLDIYSSFLYKERLQSASKIIESLVYVSMNAIIKTLSTILLKLPLQNNEYIFDAEPRSGPTFEIDDDFLLSSDINTISALHISYADKINNTLKTIQNHPFYEQHTVDDFDAFTILGTIETYLEDKLKITSLT